MRALLLSVERWTTAFSMLVACLMLALAACLGMLQIFTRFVLEVPLEWTEVIIRFSLIWMVFHGHPHGLSARRNGQRRRAVPLERAAHEKIFRHHGRLGGI